MEAVSRSLVFRPPNSGQTMKLPTRRRPWPLVLRVTCKGADGEKFSSEDVDRRLDPLRRRIHELSMVDRKEEPPVNWMKWEKKYYVCYETDSERVTICMIMKRILRGITSPSLAVGVLALVVLSVPIMVLVVFVFLVDVFSEIMNILCHLVHSCHRKTN